MNKTRLTRRVPILLSALLTLATLAPAAMAAPNDSRSQPKAETPSFGYLVRYQKTHTFGALTLNDQPVMTFPGAAGVVQARNLARTLNDMADSKPLRPELFRPGLAGKKLTIRYGKKPLVTIDEKIAKAHQEPAASLLLSWLDKLRRLLGGLPLWQQASPGGAVRSFQQGIASYYHDWFHGRRTANGEVYDKNKLTAAHLSLPFNSLVLVTNLANKKSVIVRVNDRGPFDSRFIIDLSRRAHESLGPLDLKKVRLAVLDTRASS